MAICLKRLDGDDSNKHYIGVCLSNEEKRKKSEPRNSHLTNPFIAE